MDIDLALFSIGGSGVDVPVLIPDFIGMRVIGTVRRDDTVAVERPVRRVVAVEIAAIGKDHVGSSLVGRPADSLVHEIPDETALIARIFPDKIPILLEVAHGVAHGVGIFTLYERQGRIARAVVHAPVRFSIHRDGNVSVHAVFTSLVLDWPGRIIFLYPLVAIHEVCAVAGLVAHAPDDDRRVVDVPLHHPGIPLEMGNAEVFPGCEGLGAVADSVRLDVALCAHIEAIDVAQLQPDRIVRVVARAYGIDIQALHRLDVFDHLGDSHSIAMILTQFVTVDTFHKHWLSVDKKLGIDDLDSPEAEAYRCAFGKTSLGEGLGLECVEHRGLGTPERRIGDSSGEGAGAILERFAGKGGDRVAFAVSYLESQRPDPGSNLGADGEITVHPGCDPDILKTVLLSCKQCDSPGDSAESPEILVLEIGSVTPAVDLHCDEILSRLDETGDVKSRLQLAVLAVAYLPAVDPDLDVGCGRTDSETDLLAGPGSIQIECTAVLAHMIVFNGHNRRVGPGKSSPGIADVHIDRVAVAVELPHPRHRYRAP